MDGGVGRVLATGDIGYVYNVVSFCLLYCHR